MSLWGATVITNLLSAIPWIGQDFVQFVYKTLSANVNIISGSIKILSCLFILLSILSLSSVILPTIGHIHWGAMRGQKPLTDKSKYLQLPFSFLATLAGIIDGDGYIAITRTTKGYIEILLSISLDVRDAALLYHIQSVLGFGRIAGPYSNADGTNTIKLIFSRTQLQEILLPLFFYHGIFFLTTTRRAQLQLALYIFFSRITRFDDIPAVIPSSMWLPTLPVSSLGYLSLAFFNYWIVGFTVSEGSFLVKVNHDACFQLKQRLHTMLFEAFKLVFNTDRQIGIELGLYQQFSVSSKKDIQTVIDFFTQYPLIGHKRAQYDLWIVELRNSNRYMNLWF